MSRETINKKLAASVDALHIYQSELESGQLQDVEHLSENKIETLEDLFGLVNDAHDGLEKSIEKKRVAVIDPKLLEQMNESIAALMEDESVANKVFAVHFAIYGSDIPFIEVLKDIQRLIRTINQLKNTRGKRVAHIEELDKDSKGG